MPVLLCGLISIGCYLACLFPFLLAKGPLSCALFACALRNLRGWPVDNSSLGRGWQVLGPAMSSGICLFLLQVVPMIVFGVVIFGAMVILGVSVGPPQPGARPDDAHVLTFMFGMMAVQIVLVSFLAIWGLVFVTRTMFVMPLVADRGCGFTAAWHASWEATRQRFWERLLLVVLAGILGGVGAYVCYVGIIFSLPLYYMIIAAAYEDEFGIAFDGWAPPDAIGPALAESPFAPSAVR
ncbi:MAG TPA: glycerophosphoryl diester phosphodiesterase membrane domain-containing protein [Pirellulales bacterium]|nr:glycerophosphoryl diester phosphodiesterase membrane domain-containing protein [Pirellulales bacterium]